MNGGDRTPATPGETTGTSDTSEEMSGTDSRRHPFRPVVVLMILTLLGLLVTAGYKSYRDMDSAKDYERELLQEIAETKERVRGLDRRIDSILNDPVTLERLAREELGMVRAGDVVIVLPDPERSDSDRLTDLPSAASRPMASTLASASPPGQSSSNPALP